MILPYLSISFLYCIVVGTIGEYVIHRWWMHRRGSSYYVSHHVEHHGLGANEKPHMGLFQNGNYQRVWLILLLPNLALSFLTILHLPIFTLFLLWWFWSWEYIHRAIHDEEGYTWGAYLLPWYRWSREHHLDHHKKTTTNYGAVFPWSDYFFGTTYKQRSENV